MKLFKLTANCLIPNFLRSERVERRVFFWLIVATLVLGALSIAFLKPRITTDAHALGVHVVSMFIPFACCAAILIYLVIVDRLDLLRLFAIALVYAVLAALFCDLFFTTIEHYRWDDPDRYSRYAHWMIENKTLLGGDSLRWGEDVRHYVDQPGFRYYLAGMIVGLGGEHRLLQLIGMFLYLSGMLFFIREAASNKEEGYILWVGLFFAMSLLYAAKNVLQGLGEWLAVAFIFCYAALTLRRQYLPAVLCLALAPFVRQNLLLISLLLLIFTVVVSGKRWLVLPYLLFLLLPLYHNLYFTDEFRVLVANKGAIIPLEGNLQEIASRMLNLLGWKALTYIGYASDVDALTRLLGGLFVPLGTFLVVAYCVAFKRRERWFYLVTIAATIAPTVLYGWAYFPRFVFVNQSILLVAAILLDRMGVIPTKRVPSY